MTRWTEADLAKVTARLRQSVETPLTPVPGTPPKYRNRKVRQNGQHFDSQKEYEDWKAFEFQRLNGGIRAVIRQVSLPLYGARRRIRVDFLVIENDGTHRWYDSKGYLTQAWGSKRDQVRTVYGIDIQLI